MCAGSLVARHPLRAFAAVVFVGLIVFVFTYFEPQLLFINKSVYEAPPTVPIALRHLDGTEPVSGLTATKASASERLVLSSGRFRSYEHSSHGVALVLHLVDGERFVRLEHFATSNGPDLHVFLSTTPASGPGGSFADRYVDLGHLKGNIGNQNYFVPSSIRLRRYASVVIWCNRFNVAFAAAPLSVGS
jgi:hypothetical protein